jgi:hypothetical protein
LEQKEGLRYAAAMSASSIDIIITVLFAIGIAQLAWLSVVLLRRRLPPESISMSISPMIAIWVLLWPLYEAPASIWIGIIVMGMPILIAYSSNHIFSQHLRIAWSGPIQREVQEGELPHMWPAVALITAIAIAAAFFQRAPEFGLGIGLSACLAFPAASLLDRIKHFNLGFPLHPEQTLIGHIGLIIAVSVICMWSIHIYHGIEWQRLLIATLIAGMIASVIRGFSPLMLMLPLATLAMGTTLWLL